MIGAVPSWPWFPSEADRDINKQLSACCVITGAASGLGLATARKLVHEGYTVIGCDRNAMALDRISLELGNLFRPLVCDLTSPKSMREAAETLAELQPDGIDALIHFAGLHSAGPLMDLSEHEFASVVDVNLTGVWRAQKSFFSALEVRRGRTIIISSEVAYARFSHAFSGAYSLSKIAVDQLAVTLRQELALLEPPMDVMLLNIGMFSTPLLSQAANAFSTYSDRHMGSPFTVAMGWADGMAKWYMQRGLVGDSAHHSPDIVARKVVQVLQCRKPRKRYCVSVSSLMHLVRWIPSSVLDMAIITVLRAQMYGFAQGARELLTTVLTAIMYIL